MTATNHALAGALIGLSIANPAVALPLAFVSHFVLDAIPHYDLPGDELARIRSRQFLYLQIIGNGLLCVLLVAILSLAQPGHWLLAAICAFIATTPDMLKVNKYLQATRHNKLIAGNWLNRFHHNIQWRIGPRLWWVEALWFVLAATLVAGRL